jgi:hypothetical protein
MAESIKNLSFEDAKIYLKNKGYQVVIYPYKSVFIGEIYFNNIKLDDFWKNTYQEARIEIIEYCLIKINDEENK